MRVLVVDGHQCSQPSFLDQRHAYGRADADCLEGRGFLRRQLLQIVIHHQRPARAEIGHRQPAEIGQAVVSDDVTRMRRRPVAADGKAVLIRIHVGVGATRNTEVLANHAGGDRQNGVGVGAPGGFPAQLVEKPEPRLVFPQLAGRLYRLRGLDHDRDDADRLTALAQHRRIVEIHEDLLGSAGTKQGEFLVFVGQGTARKADFHDIVIEVGHLGPGWRPPANCE